ncbi:MAG: 1-acyl-sn-glycerol-3-phosphate acyltransferase [Bacillaceae bacterium]|nr:1-acyl-sn-glycerol-3-phosphate acyltransferase [Bacillaceae bacterium]
MSNVLSMKDLKAIRSFWDHEAGVENWIVLDIYEAMSRRFIGDFNIMDQEIFNEDFHQPKLFVANHQTAIESPLFIYLMGGIQKESVVGLAKKEHRGSWIGKLMGMAFRYPGACWDQPMELIDRENPRSALKALRNLFHKMETSNYSALIHVEGTRATSTGKPVQIISSSIIDLAIKKDIPITPVRFLKGLPVIDKNEKYEFPYGFGKQDVWVGNPIYASELHSITQRERKEKILDKINNLGGSFTSELPYPEAYSWQEKAHKRWSGEYGVSEEWAIILQCLDEFTHKSDETIMFLDYIKSGKCTFTGIKKTWFMKLYQLMKA